jgi:hypothetical protein
MEGERRDGVGSGVTHGVELAPPPMKRADWNPCRAVDISLELLGTHANDRYPWSVMLSNTEILKKVCAQLIVQPAPVNAAPERDLTTMKMLRSRIPVGRLAVVLKPT